jgi:hypothetical protein
MRKKDKPGAFRIRDKGGTHTLSGLRVNGERVNIPGLSYQEAKDVAEKLFPSIGTIPNLPLLAPEPFRMEAKSSFDDDAFWTTSALKPEAAANLNASIGIGAPSPTPVVPDAVKPPPTAEETEKKAQRAKNAKSLMELIGVAGAAGDVMLGKKACEWFDKDPAINPSPRQVNDLADSIKDTLTGWFGDREIQPWQMMFLLAIGIPAAMVIQAKPAKPEKSLPSQTPLKSMP